MAIKQLQLRGISRTPSDRASADGGCAESLNVHLDGGEVAPTLPPKDISLTVYQGHSESLLRYKIVFIHKMRGVENYIGFNGSYPHAYGSTLGAGTDHEGIDYMGNPYINASLKSVASVGNILILYAPSTPYYFLFKDNAYTFLGTEIPKLAVEVASVQKASWTTWMWANGLLDTSINWNTYYADGGENRSRVEDVINQCWEEVKLQIATQRDQGVFAAPFFLKYALRLYDGNYIYTSTPILCGGGKTADWFTAKQHTRTEPLVGDMQTVDLTLNDLFTVFLRGSYQVGAWNDVVKAIDIFASEPIYTPAMDAQFGKVDAQGNIIFDKMDSASRAQTIKDAVLSKGQFYKVASIEFGTNDMSNLVNGKYQLLSSDFVSGDNLFTQEQLVEGYRDGNSYIPESDSKNFNNRLMLIGAKEVLSRGDAFLNGQVANGPITESSPTTARYALRYKIVDSVTGQSHYVIAHYYNGDTVMKNSFYLENYGGVTALHHGSETIPSGVPYYPSNSYAWICYPDTRCKEVEILFYNEYGVFQSGKKVPMEEHPLLECSYAFIGFGNSWKTIKTASPNPYADTTNFGETENRTIEAYNKLFLSEMDNPLLYPASQIVTFSDKLIGAATTSVPLSEGQFGEFPMYIFTEGGIRVLVTTAEGTFASNMTHPNLSRHVALKGTILGLEQSVVFCTERGVMLLTGSGVQELSAEMNGKPVLFDDGLADSGQVNSEMRNLIQSSAWAGLFNPMNDTNTFMQFVRSAKPAYDHNGARLIFFHTSKQYQYEYRFTTQSWHKIFTSVVDPNILNSYPDCYVSWVSSGTATVLNFTTFLNSDTAISDTKVVDGQTVRNEFLGTIITRPIDLGEPDIRKAIRSIRVRGKYGRGAVQYVLLGSFDNIHWCRMKSLRGGSYKYFRIILLTSLTPNERITWIDVDYEIRFTNRLR